MPEIRDKTVSKKFETGAFGPTKAWEARMEAPRETLAPDAALSARASRVRLSTFARVVLAGHEGLIAPPSNVSARPPERGRALTPNRTRSDLLAQRNANAKDAAIAALARSPEQPTLHELSKFTKDPTAASPSRVRPAPHGDRSPARAAAQSAHPNVESTSAWWGPITRPHREERDAQVAQRQDETVKPKLGVKRVPSPHNAAAGTQTSRSQSRRKITPTRNDSGPMCAVFGKPVIPETERVRKRRGPDVARTSSGIHDVMNWWMPEKSARRADYAPVRPTASRSVSPAKMTREVPPNRREAEAVTVAAMPTEVRDPSLTFPRRRGSSASVTSRASTAATTDTRRTSVTTSVVAPSSTKMVVRAWIPPEPSRVHTPPATRVPSPVRRRASPQMNVNTKELLMWA